MSRYRRLPLAAALLLAGVCFSGPLQERTPPAPPAVAAIEQNNIGVGYMNQFAFGEAADAFRKSLAADPDFNLARINLGIALLYNIDQDEALAVFEEALTRDPANPYTHFCLGLLYKNRGEAGKAIEHFQRVAEVDANCAPNHYNLGVLYARQRKASEAEAALRKAVELEPTNTSALYNLGTLLLKSGKADEGNALLARFRALQQNTEAASGMGVGSQYGEMGIYAMAMDYHPSPGSTMRPSPSAVFPFSDRTNEAGLAAVRGTATGAPALPREFEASDWSAEFLRSQLLPSLGPGIALADLDNDGGIDAVITRFDAPRHAWQTLVLRNEAGKFADITRTSGIVNTGAEVAAAIGDFNNDDLPDVYLVGSAGNRLYRNLGKNRFEAVTSFADVSDGVLPVSATFFDYDHDGDLDLYVARYADITRPPQTGKGVFPNSMPGASNRVFRNNGNSTFTDLTEKLGLGAPGLHTLAAVPSDVDNDRDIDLLVLNEDGAPQIFSNERNDAFSNISSRVLADVKEAFSIATVGDFNRDGAMDLFALPRGERPGALLLNTGKGFRHDKRSTELLAAGGGPRFGTGNLDYDLDGDLDLFVLSRSSTLWENTGEGRFVAAGAFPVEGLRAAAAADFNGDGRIDILGIDETGSPRLLQNEGSARANWVAVHLEGLRSNKLGFGAKVEFRALDQYQKFEIAGQSGSRSQESPIVWFGLGNARKADTVTVRWPSGILQSEINAEAGKVVRIRELDRKGTSCPLLYTWNGKTFEFVTDFLGGSAIGYLQAPGRYSYPDSDEYVRIEGRRLAVKDGRYLLNLNNQLEEVIMFDQAQLLVVDHPAGTEIYPDERLMPAPPFPEHRIYTSKGARPPRRAVDDAGTDILPLISRKDRTYPESFRSLRFKGYVEPHSITLDLGDLAGAPRILLLMDAWIDYADSSSNLAASQSGISLQPPSLQVRDAGGDWRTVIPSMGFPAGLPKTMTVDLTGKFLSRNFEVRILTSMKIYWDRILVDTSVDAPVKVTRLDPVSAVLQFRGYPRYYTPDGRLPWIYDYGRIEPNEQWGTHAGAYTRFGDVRELLLGRDDKFVITRHGDEIALAFDAIAAPPLRPGWARDFLLYADGYGKDMDLNSLVPETIGPLPFHGMSRYPYPPTEHYPDDEEHRSYQRRYNTRIYSQVQSLAP